MKKTIRNISCLILLLLLMQTGLFAAITSVSIDSPEPDSEVSQGDYINFQGSAVSDSDPEDISFKWLSSKNGPLSGESNFSTNVLKAGEHTITLTVKDESGDSKSTSIKLIIKNTAPVAKIIRPNNNDEFQTNQNIRFEGYGEDEEDGIISNETLRWVSDLNGFLGEGPILDIDNLMPGEHQISLSVTDSSGFVSEIKSISIIVKNTDPIASILAPKDESVFLANQLINFSGSGIDDEDGILTGQSLSWSSDRDGIIGSGNELKNISLSPGAHTISLKVTDKNGASHSASIRLITGNNPPVAKINSPANKEYFLSNSEVHFQGIGTDHEDGILGASSLTWYSSLDDTLGTGTSLHAKNLSPGLHTIRLVAIDALGAEGEDQISISYGNTKPDIPQIDYPEDKAVFERGEKIIFSGHAEDQEDGELSGDSLIWQSNREGEIKEIGKGNSFYLDNLKSGTHIISLKATDSMGASSNSSVSITIKELKADISHPQLEEGSLEKLIISGGTGPYSISNRYPQLMGFKVIREKAHELELEIEALKEGESTLNITDKAGNKLDIHIFIYASLNSPPPARAEISTKSAFSGEKIRLTALPSEDIRIYRWRQIQGPIINTFPAEGQSLEFIAPNVRINTGFSFQLEVEGKNGLKSWKDISLIISPNGVYMRDLPEDAIAIKSFSGKKIAIKQDKGLIDFSCIKSEDIEEVLNRPESFPYDLLKMSKSVDKNTLAKFTIYLEEEAPADSVWLKYHPEEGWINFDRKLISNNLADGAVFNLKRDQVTLYISDNGPYDADPRPGIVEDPSGLAIYRKNNNNNNEDKTEEDKTERPEDNEKESLSSGKDSSSCFLNSLYF